MTNLWLTRWNAAAGDVASYVASYVTAAILGQFFSFGRAHASTIFLGSMASLVHLLFQDLSIFADQEVHAARGLVFVFVDSVLVGYFAAPIAQQGERDSNLVGEGFVGEGTIHAHTQNLGVGRFQGFQIRLESFHLLGSTTGERENVERQHDVLLAAVVAQLHFFEVVAVEILQREIGRHVTHLGHLGRVATLREQRGCSGHTSASEPASNSPARTPECFFIGTPPTGVMSQHKPARPGAQT